MNAETATDKVRIDHAAGFLADLRACGITLRADRGKLPVRFGSYQPTEAVVAAIRAEKPALVALLEAEQQPHAGPTAQPAIQTLPEPALKPVQQGAPAERAILICGASSWPTSRASVIRRRLATLPADSTVVVFGDVERRTRKGAPAGVAAIALSTCAALGLRAEVEQDVDSALSRTTSVISFHQMIARSRTTAAIVERARTLGLPAEVVSGMEIPTGRLLRREKEWA